MTLPLLKKWMNDYEKERLFLFVCFSHSLAAVIVGFVVAGRGINVITFGIIVIIAIVVNFNCCYS